MPAKQTECMTEKCRHTYPEPSEQEMVQCCEDYVMFRVKCVYCRMEGYAGGNIDWKPTFWTDEPSDSDLQPHNPL